MLITIGVSLLAGAILDLLVVDTLLANGLNNLFNINLSKAGYYSIFVLIGMLKFVFRQDKSLMEFIYKDRKDINDKLNNI